MISSFLQNTCQMSLFFIPDKTEKNRFQNIDQHIIASILTFSGVGSAIALTASVIETVVSSPFALIALIANQCKKNNSFSNAVLPYFNRAADNTLLSLADLFIANIASFALIGLGIGVFAGCKACCSPAAPTRRPEGSGGGGVSGVPTGYAHQGQQPPASSYAGGPAGNPPIAPILA